MFNMGPSFWGNSGMTEYFTSVIYPVIVEDTIVVGVPDLPPDLQRSLTMPVVQDTASVPTPSISSANLTTVIAYLSYTVNPTEDVASVPTPSISSANLTTVIAYPVYNASPTEDVASVPTPSISSATLTTVINYINLTTWQEEKTSVPTPSIVSGSLT